MNLWYKILISALFLSTQSWAGEGQRDLFNGKRVLITGGTGYLGSTLAEALVKEHNPACVIIASRDEVKLFRMQQRFAAYPVIRCILMDVRDYQSLLQQTKDVDIVFHVAALKRMDALEDNVLESIKTNVLGSVNIFNACVANNVERVLFISTDKACLPINTYGACKCVSEKVFTNYDYKNVSTIFTAVRFGNILESTGSVIPIFSDKIKRGEDITLTDPAMTRFIINKDDAVAFIFNAMRHSVGGEIFVKKLPSLALVDLIEIIKERYNAYNQVKVVGLRPGEKIHEILINSSEIERSYEFDEMFIITPSLGQWRENLRDNNCEPLYIKQGQQLSGKGMRSFSSKRAVLSRDNLRDLFKRLNVLEKAELLTRGHVAAAIRPNMPTIDWWV